MAVLKEQENNGSGLNIEHLAPAGPYVATCIKIIDIFGVMRQKFQSQEMIKKDITRFVFGVYTPDKKLYIVQTFEFTISTSKDANLMAFLKAWTGQDAKIGWDYIEMEGKGAALVIQHVASKKNPSKSYAQIASIGPVFPQMVPMVAPKEVFAKLLDAALKPPANAPPNKPATPLAAKEPGSPWAAGPATTTLAPEAGGWAPPADAPPATQPATTPVAPPDDDDIPF